LVIEQRNALLNWLMHMAHHYFQYYKICAFPNFTWAIIYVAIFLLMMSVLFVCAESYLGMQNADIQHPRRASWSNRLTYSHGCCKYAVTYDVMQLNFQCEIM